MQAGSGRGGIDIQKRPRWRQPGIRIALLALMVALTTACGSTAGSSPSPDPSPEVSSGTTVGPLTDAEIAGLTSGAVVPINAEHPAPLIDAAAAEATVRATYPGQRATIGVVRIAMRLPSGDRVGWLVALTPSEGAPCPLHAGLLPRGIEGGVVDDQTGETFWGFVCG